MIIDAPQRNAPRRLRRIAGAAALVVSGWLAVVIALTFGSAPGKSMAIIGSPAEALAIIAKANGRVLAANNYVTFARSDDADFVTRLYAAAPGNFSSDSRATASKSRFAGGGVESGWKRATRHRKPAAGGNHSEWAGVVPSLGRRHGPSAPHTS